jgi:hypothetical protein
MAGTTINNTRSHTVTLGSSNIYGPLTITGAGAIHPKADGADGLILPGSAANTTVSNSGYIYSGNGSYSSAAAGGNGGIGLYVETRATAANIINNNVIMAGYGGDGYSSGGIGGEGISLLAGSLNNFGSIIAGYGGSSQYGAGGQGGLGASVASGGYLKNPGYIYGGYGGSGQTNGGNGGDGVSVGPGGEFFNTGSGIVLGSFGGSGTISGGNGGDGVLIYAGAAVSNLGNITAGYGGSAESLSGVSGDGGIGVVVLSGASFSNEYSRGTSSITTYTGIVTGGAGGDNAYGNGGLGGAGISLASDAKLLNQGSITGGAGGASTGIGYEGGAGGAGVFVNNAYVLNQLEISGGIGGAGIGSGGSGGAGVYLDGGTLVTSGVITGGSGGSNGTVSGSFGDAVQFGTNVGSLIVDPGASFTGEIAGNAALDDVLELAGTTASYLGGIGTQFIDVNELSFATGATWTIEGDLSGLADGETIIGFAPTNTIILDGFAETSYTYDSGIGLELTDGTALITIGITGDFSTGDFIISDPSITTTIALEPAAPCFTAGTRILTQRGETPVEQLEVGDNAILIDGSKAAIIWVGKRGIDISRHPRPETVQPIRIAAGALDGKLPVRDLIVSPDHALYLEGLLIPAKALLNGYSIAQLNRAAVTYYHVELAEHAVLLAEGTPAESYLVTGNRAALENGANSVILHPDFAQTLRETTGCAPFAESGPVVERVRAGILERAGFETTSDPHLTIRYRNGEAIISSRHAIPGEITADPRDRRTLGVKIATLHISGQPIPLDHPDLNTGWHDMEPDGRWTNGTAVIPTSLLKNSNLMRVTLAATLAYPIPEPLRKAC